MLGEYLRYLGYEVIEASGGQMAVDYAREYPPALIFMDLGMTGMDGWTATRELRSHPLTKDIIVIALTARAMPREDRFARDAGCDAVVVKPYDVKRLGEVVVELMQHGRDALPLLNTLSSLAR